MGRVHTTIAALFLLALCPQVSAQSVSGVVVRFGTGEPLEGTTVELYPVPNGRNPRPDVRPTTTSTNRDGGFQFQNLQPGPYRLVAARTDGFIGAEFGQTSVEGPAMVLTLHAGDTVRDVRITLTPTSAISGRALDSDGEPLGRVRVQAMRTAYLPGYRQGFLAVVQAVETNDLGEYRFFGLSPGRYYISGVPADPLEAPALFIGRGSQAAIHAESPRVTRRTLEDGTVLEQIHVPTYFPNTRNMAEAVPIDVFPGTDVGRIDLTIAGPVPSRRVRGRVIDGITGQPLANALVHISPVNQSPNPTILTVNTDPQGSFDLAGAIAGDYYFCVSTPTDPAMTVFQLLQVGETDLDGLTFTAIPAFDVPMNVAMEGRPADGNNVTISLARDRITFFLQRLFTNEPDVSLLSGVLAAGAFQSVVLSDARPGIYRVVLADGPANSYIKSVRFGGVDILRDGLQLVGPPEGPLEIVIGTDAGSISGILVNERREPVPNAAAVLIPSAPNRHRIDLNKVVYSDASGRFRLDRVAPGDYGIFAWEHVQTAAWEDPRFVQNYERFGQRVHVDGASTQDVTVTIIPAGLQ